jgi:hypothetical protein
VNPRRRPTSARTTRLALLLSSTVLAAFVLVSQVARVAHFVLVAHAHCAEHGDIAHSDHAAASDDGSDHGESVALRTGEAGGEHEHCDVLGMPVTPLAVAPSLADASLLDAYLLPWSVRPSVGHRVLDVLDLAPKSSPPV